MFGGRADIGNLAVYVLTSRNSDSARIIQAVQTNWHPCFDDVDWRCYVSINKTQ